jgi:cytosine/adenosine deaminase-related metal-dependent hydrolase
MISGRGSPGNGRAAPPEGPVDIVVERGRITDIIPLDAVSLADHSASRATGDLIIDATGRFVMPALVDLHAHVPGPDRAGEQAIAYSFRLWLGHGVTTLRDAGTGAGLEEMTQLRRLAADSATVAPRLRLYKRWPNTSRTKDKGHSIEEARALVREYNRQGADGIKVSHGPGHYPDVLAAINDEARNLEMDGVMVDLKVSESDALVASRAGVVSVEHWYGVPDAALPGSQNLPLDYNYLDELVRFRLAGHLWKEAADYPERLSDVIDELIANGTAWVPTFQIYEANLDFMRVVTLPWRDSHVHPIMLDRWRPRADVHASFHTEWRTADEIAWKENYRIWMQWLYEFWSRGGMVGLGSDAGSQQSLYGFGTIRELELLQQAGIHPLDVVRIATTRSAEIAGLGDELCGIRYGCVADMIVVDGNPLDNFKVLYGGGFAYYGTDREGQGGVIWTIKDGQVFDAQALLAEAEWYVATAKADADR